MEIITYPLLFISAVVWFFSAWQKNKEEAARLKRLDDLEEAAWQREKAYWDELRAKRDEGDQQAANMCRMLGLR